MIGNEPPPHESPLAMGTVGWDDDGGTVMDLGDQSNDGTSLVRVQLFRGRDPSTPLNATVGQGQKILCQLSNSVTVIPPRGTLVLVAFPDGAWGNVPGGAVILATLGGSNWQALGNSSQGDTVIPALGGAARVVLRANGTIVLRTNDSNAAGGNDIFLKISPSQLQFVAPWGSIVFDATGFRVKHQSGTALRLGGVTLPSPLSSLGSYIKLTAALVKLDASLSQIGPDIAASNFQPAVYGPDPSPTAALSVLLSALSTYIAAVQAYMVKATSFIELAGTVVVGGANALVDPTSLLPPLQTAVTTAEGAVITALTAAAAPVTGLLTSNALKVSQ